MKTNFQYPSCDTMENPRGRKNKPGRKMTQKSETPVSYNLKDFLSHAAVFTVNEYGERVISGKRIC